MNREDLELEQAIPTSIREIVLNELYQDNANKKHEMYPKPESIEDLLAKVYAHIERKALEVFNSKEPWALKAWAYSNILKEAVIEERNQLLKQRIIADADQPMVQELISPIIDWQQSQPFDPIAHFEKRIKRKSKKTKLTYMHTVAKFVAKEGRGITPMKMWRIFRLGLWNITPIRTHIIKFVNDYCCFSGAWVTRKENCH